MKILVAVVGLVAVGGVAWYFAGGRADDVAPLNVEEYVQDVGPNASEAAESEGTFSGSMKDLLGRAGAWRCEVSVDSDGVVSTGTTYVSGGKMRADFTSNIPQVGNVASHMITRENTVYTWTSMMNRGFKFPVENGEVEASGQNSQQANMYNKNYDYDCKMWAADEGVFSLPSGVTF